MLCAHTCCISNDLWGCVTPVHRVSVPVHAAQMMFRVKDLEASKQYYTEALGMKLIREKENEKVSTPAAAG
jgi:catechol-2,3-dioxygenase